MPTCPHCHQPIPETSGGAKPILLWGGLGLLLGVLGSCLIGIVMMAAITTIGSQANKTFQTVGNSLSSGGR